MSGNYVRFSQKSDNLQHLTRPIARTGFKSITKVKTIKEHFRLKIGEYLSYWLLKKQSILKMPTNDQNTNIKLTIIP